MSQRTFTDILNVFKLDITLSNYCILDSSWRSDSFIDPHSRLYYIRNGEGWIRCNGKTVKLEKGLKENFNKKVLIPTVFTSAPKVIEKFKENGSAVSILANGEGADYNIPFKKSQKLRRVGYKR